MPTFSYVAAEKGGGIRKGSLQAASKAEAVKAIQAQGLMLMELKQELARMPAPKPKVTPPPPPKPKPVAAAKPPEPQVPLTRPGWSLSERAIFLRQLASMFEAGIHLHRCLETLCGQVHRPLAAQRLEVAVAALGQGTRLSTAMRGTGLFTPVQVGTVAVGEESGKLGQLLGDLAELEEREVNLYRKLVSQLTYPAVVLLCMLAALGVLGNIMGRVLASLPAVAESNTGLLGVVTGLMTNRLTMLALLVLPGLVLYGCFRAWHSLEGREWLERRLLLVPKFGDLLRRLEAARCCRMLGLLVASGLTIDRVMQLVSVSTPSPVARQALLGARESLRNGATLSQSLAGSGFFSPEVVHLTAAGEESGRLSTLLATVAEYSEMEVEHFLVALTALVEPVLMMVLGVAVGVIILATFAPVYQVLESL
ncbi:MAG: type II secretion system F family protein [Candidatus Eremiobacteraeota bacterium]|nr:type II secretion system F family protein [Candidatus Eremiobacteraeota bacterium]